MNSPTEQARQALEKLYSADPEDTQKRESLLAVLDEQISALSKQSTQLQEEIVSYQETYKKLTSPANRIGILLEVLDEDRVIVLGGDQDFVCAVDPNVPAAELQPGTRVMLSEAFSVVGVLAPPDHGPIVTVLEVMPEGRLRVGVEGPGQVSRTLRRVPSLMETQILVGDQVRTDPAGRLVLATVATKETTEYFLEEIPETPWSAVGGQAEALRVIQESIEAPLLHSEVFEKFGKKPVKGILLYGPPGCGKTLIGRAVASNLSRQLSDREGRPVKECFLHISGPKVLNMWLGETERMVREIFATARKRAEQGHLVVIFLDEAESILRTRSSGRWLNISNTVVPQFCAELDGVVGLKNVILILTSNRPDYIDPAILRPERIDRKVKVQRPDREGTPDILSLYITPQLPLDPALVAEFRGEADCARRELVEKTLDYVWREDQSSKFLELAMKNGSTKTLYQRDLVSGALLRSIVDRAKEIAIRRALADLKGDHGLRVQDFTDAADAEFRENEIFPKSDQMEDWLKLLDVEPEAVAKVRPIDDSRPLGFAQKAII